MIEKNEQNKNTQNHNSNKNGDIKIDVKKELDKLKSETLKELKEILYEIEKTA